MMDGFLRALGWTVCLWTLGASPAFAQESESETQQMSASGSQGVALRKLSECGATERSAAQQERREPNYAVACQRYIDVIKARMTPEQRLHAENVMRANQAQLQAQRDTSAAKRAQDAENAVSERDFPRGTNRERYNLARLSECRQRAVESQDFPITDCPERLGLSTDELREVELYVQQHLRTARSE